MASVNLSNTNPNIPVFTGEGSPTFKEWTMKLGVAGKAKNWSALIETDHQVQAARAKTTQTQADLDLIDANDLLVDHIILSVSGEAMTVCSSVTGNYDAFEIMSALKKKFHKEPEPPKAEDIVKQMGEL